MQHNTRRGSWWGLRPLCTVRLCLVIVPGVLLIAVLLVVFGALSGLVWGRDEAAYLQLCEDQPCMMGLLPGYHEWAEAQRVLADFTPRMSTAAVENRQIRVQWEGGLEVEAYPSRDLSRVGRIYLRFADDRPLRAGWVLGHFGQPCGVSIYNRVSIDTLTLRYPAALVNVALIDDRFTPQSPVTSIQFNDPALELRAQPDPCTDNISQGVTNRPWRGFFGLQRYREMVQP